jgi:hypothetical protein
MDTDLALTVGILLAVLSVPSLLSAWVDGRAPRIGAIMVLVGLALIVTALVESPGGYEFNQVPTIMLKTITGFFE